MKYISCFMFFCIFFCSCKDNEKMVECPEQLISGAYRIESSFDSELKIDSDWEVGNVYIFSKNQLEHFLKLEDGTYTWGASFDYYTKEDEIILAYPIITQRDV